MRGRACSFDGLIVDAPVSPVLHDIIAKFLDRFAVGVKREHYGVVDDEESLVYRGCQGDARRRVTKRRVTGIDVAGMVVADFHERRRG